MEKFKHFGTDFWTCAVGARTRRRECAAEIVPEDREGVVCMPHLRPELHAQADGSAGVRRHETARALPPQARAPPVLYS